MKIFSKFRKLIQYIIKWNPLRFLTLGIKNRCEAEKDIIEQIYKAYEKYKECKTYDF